MNKLYIATCAILVPLVGCTGMVGDNTTVLESGAGGVLAAGGSSGASHNAGGSAGTGSGTAAGAGAGAVTAAGAGGVTATGGVSSVGGSSNGGACSVAVLPAGVQTMLANKCATCHGSTPLSGLPSLVSYADLTAPSKSDPNKTNAVVALARIQSSTLPMPPAPGAPVTAADISALQNFISQGYAKPSCTSGTGGAGGSSGSGGAGTAGTAGATGMDPLLASPTCTSMTSWTGGNRGSSSMNPGMACISCHSSGDGPRFSIAGTVYPTGHEPDRCNSSVGTAGARIVIIGADGKMVTLTPDAVGNFSSNTAVKTPFQAKVTYQGRERLMVTAQSSGDCNSCHSQNGSMNAPGRITVP